MELRVRSWLHVKEKTRQTRKTLVLYVMLPNNPSLRLTFRTRIKQDTNHPLSWFNSSSLRGESWSTLSAKDGQRTFDTINKKEREVFTLSSWLIKKVFSLRHTFKNHVESSKGDKIPKSNSKKMTLHPGRKEERERERTETLIRGGRKGCTEEESRL